MVETTWLNGSSTGQISVCGVKPSCTRGRRFRLAVSENRLILARSYFTETTKQKNNSKARLSRKPAPKFNKWLFLSQCSHNCCSETGMGVRQRLGGINCYQNQPRWTRLSRPRRLPGTHARLQMHVHVRGRASNTPSLGLPDWCIFTRKLAWWEEPGTV